MGLELEKKKLENIDKIKIGVCLELNFMLDNFYNDFNNLTNFIENNKNLLNNQNLFNITSNLESLKSSIYSLVEIVIDDIDKNNVFLDYSKNTY